VFDQLKSRLMTCGRNSCLRVATAIMLITAYTPHGHADPLPPGIKIYNEIKNIEKKIKDFPQIHGVVNVGTFNAQTGKFIGPMTPEDVEGDDGRPGESGGPFHKPKPAKHFPSVPVAVDAVRVGLKFRAKNYAGTIQVTANGVSAKSKPGESFVIVEVGAALEVNWTLTVGKATVRNRFRLARPRAGAGAFTIPAMPILVLYEPPMDEAARNYAEYTVSKAIGTSIHMTLKDSLSIEKPGTPAQFQTDADIKTGLEQTGKYLAEIPTPYTKAIGGILSLIAGGMGNITQTTTKGRQVTHDHGLELRATSTNNLKTAARKGPGQGDLILYLRNVKLGWMVTQMVGSQTSVKLVMLGYEKETTVDVLTLKSELKTIGTSKTKLGPITGLDSETIREMLQLDPFAVSPDANLEDFGDRFQFFAAPECLSSCNRSIELKLESTETNMTENVEFSTTLTDYTEGSMGNVEADYVNGGFINGSHKKIASMTLGNLKQNLKAGTVIALLQMFAGEADKYAIVIYYDTAFGTFAFKREKVGESKYEGIATLNGLPLANHVVSLHVGGKVYKVRSDSSGHYSFRYTSIPAGAAMVRFGTTTQRIVTH
jgi:hypothetical protein